MLNERFLELNESWVAFQAKLPEHIRILLCLEPGPARDRLRDGCQNAGWRAETADTAAEAAARLGQRAVDLLVVAEDPPDMTALNLLRFARGRPNSPLAIILASNPSPRKILETIQLGKTDYLLEPEQRPEELLERIRSRAEQLGRQKLQLRMLSDLRRLHQESDPQVRATLVAELQSRLGAHRKAVGPMNEVLVATPDAQTRRLLVATLRGMGLVPTEAETGAEAIGHLEIDGSDVLVISGTLPDFSLSEILLRVRRVAPDLPLVLLADVQDPESVLSALRLGFSDGIRTPIASPEAAGHRIARLLRERRRERLADLLIRELYRLVRSAHAHAPDRAQEQVAAVFDQVVVPDASPPGVPEAGAASATEDPDALRLTSSEIQVISEPGRADVLEADNLPDTAVLSYIDDILGQGPRGGVGGPVGAGQRLTPRVERSTFVRYGPTGTEQAALGFAHDLSLGGMFILSDNPPPVGTDLQIELQLPTGDQIERIRVQGRVMWHSDEERRPPQGDGFGVQFTVVSRAASAALLRAVTEPSD